MWFLIITVPLFIWLDFYLFKLFYNSIFRDDEDFNDSVKYTFTPDLFSLFKGEYFKDWFAEFKLGGFIFLCVATVLVEIFLLKGISNFM